MSGRKVLTSSGTSGRVKNPLKELVAESLKDKMTYTALWGLDDDDDVELYTKWNNLVEEALGDNPWQFAREFIPRLISEIKKIPDDEMEVFFRPKFVWVQEDKPLPDSVTYHCASMNNILFLLQNVYIHNIGLEIQPSARMVLHDKKYEDLRECFNFDKEQFSQMMTASLALRSYPKDVEEMGLPEEGKIYHLIKNAIKAEEPVKKAEVEEPVKKAEVEEPVKKAEAAEPVKKAETEVLVEKLPTEAPTPNIFKRMWARIQKFANEHPVFAVLFGFIAVTLLAAAVVGIIVGTMGTGFIVGGVVAGLGLIGTPAAAAIATFLVGVAATSATAAALVGAAIVTGVSWVLYGIAVGVAAIVMAVKRGREGAESKIAEKSASKSASLDTSSSDSTEETSSTGQKLSKDAVLARSASAADLKVSVEAPKKDKAKSVSDASALNAVGAFHHDNAVKNKDVKNDNKDSDSESDGLGKKNKK